MEVNLSLSGYVRTYILLPSTIWGIASGLLADKGIQHKYSEQVPLLIRASLARGRGGMVGQGKNIWPDVHINDSMLFSRSAEAELFLIASHQLPTCTSSSSTPH